MTEAERARLAVDLVLYSRTSAAEQVEALQELQQLVQAELARLWSQAEGMPGHAWNEAGPVESER